MKRYLYNILKFKKYLVISAKNLGAHFTFEKTLSQSGVGTYAWCDTPELAYDVIDMVVKHGDLISDIIHGSDANNDIVMKELMPTS